MPSVIAMRSGLLDLDGIGRSCVRMLPHSPRYAALNARDFDVDAEAIQDEMQGDRDGVERGRPLCERLCPEWLKLVDELSHGEPEWGECLQRWFGLCLTTSMAHEKMLWLIGSKRSGKGTITDALQAVLGDDACASSGLDDLIRPFERSGWVGKLALFLDEAQPGRYTDHVGAAAMMKRITGRAPVSVDLKHKDIMPSVRLSVRITVTANTLPRLLDSSNALASRIIALPVDRLGGIDPGRKARILAEVPGIFAWALFGLRDLARGAEFTLPERGKKMLADYERLSSPMHAFVSDCLVVPERAAAAGYSVREDVLQAVYLSYCRAAGVHGVSRDRLLADLVSLVPWVRRVTKVEAVGDMRMDRQRVAMLEGLRPLMLGDDFEPDGSLRRAEPKACVATNQLAPLGFDVLPAGEGAAMGGDDGLL
jgi:P4 family phage/plasmid primase-like protien